jgi:hypothetical protein
MAALREVMTPDEIERAKGAIKAELFAARANAAEAELKEERR